MGIERIIDPKERERAHAEVGYVDFYSAGGASSRKRSARNTTAT